LSESDWDEKEEEENESDFESVPLQTLTWEGIIQEVIQKAHIHMLLYPVCDKTALEGIRIMCHKIEYARMV